MVFFGITPSNLLHDAEISHCYADLYLERKKEVGMFAMRNKEKHG